MQRKWIRMKNSRIWPGNPILLEWYWYNGIGVAQVLLVRFWYMLWARVGLSVVGWLGARGGTSHSWHKPISIIINHKFTIPSSISTLGEFSLSQNGQSILAQPNFHIPLTKVACAHRSMNYFHIFWCHNYNTALLWQKGSKWHTI